MSVHHDIMSTQAALSHSHGHTQRVDEAGFRLPALIPLNQPDIHALIAAASVCGRSGSENALPIWPPGKWLKGKAVAKDIEENGRDRDRRGEGSSGGGGGSSMGGVHHHDEGDVNTCLSKALILCKSVPSMRYATRARGWRVVDRLGEV